MPINVFQSTPSARRATAAFLHTAAERAISIHALREESDCGVGIDQSSHVQISIHALREESDVFHVAVYKDLGISIHALREESDLPLRVFRQPQVSISIHALREEGDQYRVILKSRWKQFQSTPSARRATIR